jgi:hypothetical protein
MIAAQGDKSEGHKIQADNSSRPLPAPSTKSKAPEEEVRIRGHSRVFYWWIVWAYGYVCAVVSVVWGSTFSFDGMKHWHVHASASLGTSFILIILFVILFSNVRVQTFVAIAFVAVAALAVELAQRYLDISILCHARMPVVVYMNAAFYAVFSALLSIIWLAVLGLDKLVYWRFGYTRAEWIHVLDHKADENFPMNLMSVKLLPADFFRKIVGFLAADIVIQPEGEKGRSILIENVLRAKMQLQKIQKLQAISARRTAHQTQGNNASEN